MKLTSNARIAGVVGWPVSHSRSPRLHGFWLDHYGIDGAYVPLPVRPEHLGDAMGALPKLGFAGVNITVPHKETALAFMDEVDDDARRAGAVNTVAVSTDGRLAGSNTDGYGFIENLRTTICIEALRGRAACIIGAGGAARAICLALLDAGVRTIRLTNRTATRARALADVLSADIDIVDWDERHGALDEVALLVNTTTLGMTGNPPLDLDLGTLPPDAVVTDIVYTPLETPLLTHARARGNTVVDGLGMLLHQARPGFRAWFGVEPEVTTDLRAAVLAE
ncbi:MAG: shikimate dehydrogenase [Alphaproteobacteria bacterium]